MTPRSPPGGRFIRRHGRGGQTNHVERADEIDLDDTREMSEWLHALLTEYAFRRRNAGGADGAMDRPESLERALERTLHFVRTCHVGANEGGGAAKPFRVCAPFASLTSRITTRPPAGDDHFGGRAAEA